MTTAPKLADSLTVSLGAYMFLFNVDQPGQKQLGSDIVMDLLDVIIVGEGKLVKEVRNALGEFLKKRKANDESEDIIR